MQDVVAGAVLRQGVPAANAISRGALGCLGFGRAALHAVFHF